MTIATIMGTCMLFIAVGWAGHAYQTAALVIGAIVSTAAANAGATSQDLKTGFIVGATPWRQQVGFIIGVFVSAFAIGGTLFLMHTSPTFGPIGSDKLPAPQGTLMATLIQGDRKSTRLNSSHVSISYAGFRLKNKRRRRALSAGAEQPQ